MWKFLGVMFLVGLLIGYFGGISIEKDVNGVYKVAYQDGYNSGSYDAEIKTLGYANEIIRREYMRICM